MLSHIVIEGVLDHINPNMI